jgi:hypothetical protein
MNLAAVSIELDCNCKQEVDDIANKFSTNSKIRAILNNNNNNKFKS